MGKDGLNIRKIVF